MVKQTLYEVDLFGILFHTEGATHTFLTFHLISILDPYGN